MVISRFLKFFIFPCILVRKGKNGYFAEVSNERILDQNFKVDTRLRDLWLAFHMVKADFILLNPGSRNWPPKITFFNIFRKSILATLRRIMLYTPIKFFKLLFSPDFPETTAIQ